MGWRRRRTLADAREQRTKLTARLEAFETDYVLGRITGVQLQKATATVAVELAQIDERMAKALRRSTSSEVLRAADPSATLLAAPIDVQRAVTASLNRVRVQPRPRRGVAWSSDRLSIARVLGHESS